MAERNLARQRLHFIVEKHDKMVVLGVVNSARGDLDEVHKALLHAGIVANTEVARHRLQNVDVRVHGKVARLRNGAVAAARAACVFKVIVALFALVFDVIIRHIGIPACFFAARCADVLGERIQQKALAVGHFRVVFHRAVCMQPPETAAVFVVPEALNDVVKRAVGELLILLVAENAVRVRKCPQQTCIQHEALGRVLVNNLINRHGAVKAAVFVIDGILLPERENRTVQQILFHFIAQL